MTNFIVDMNSSSEKPKIEKSVKSLISILHKQRRAHKLVFVGRLINTKRGAGNYLKIDEHVQPHLPNNTKIVYSKRFRNNVVRIMPSTKLVSFHMNF